MKTSDLTRIAILSAVCILTRLYLNIIPNVKILSDVILILAIENLKESLFVNAVTMVTTSFVLGFGIWVLFQVVDFFILAVFNYAIFNVFKLKKTLITKTIAVSVSGFLYGLIITLMECMTVMGMNVFIARYMTSIPFDINHMIGNTVIYIF